jgi:3-phenylpropionate/trans-cinnamate dioxygenase ferredoxin component
MSYRRLCSLDELSEGVALAVPLGDRTRVALLRQRGEVFAFSDCCTHEEASLSEGFVDGYVVECPKHGASFDVRTGKVLSLPATHDLPTYPVRLAEGQVWMDLDEEPLRKAGRQE